MERMYGVTFGDKHSFNDWGIYWNGYSEDSPEPQRSSFEIPYKNGMLDATTALTDKIFYKSRKITFDFIVYENDLSWPEVQAMVLGDVHGKSLHVITDTDPDWYWDAYNCVVGTPSQEEEFLKFSIECECYPYKLKNELTEKQIVVTGSGQTLVCPNSRMEVNPTFVTEKEVQVQFTNTHGTQVSIAMSAGTHTYKNIEFVKGDNVLTFNNIVDYNYIPYPYRFTGSTTVNDERFTIGTDRSVTCTCTYGSSDVKYAVLFLTDYFNLEEGTYVLSGCPPGGSASTYYLSFRDRMDRKIAMDIGEGYTFTIDSDSAQTPRFVSIYIGNTRSAGTLVFNPVITKVAPVTVSYREGEL